MDNDLIKFLIKVGLLSTLVLILYFVISPYQNCLRVIDDPEPMWKIECVKETGW